MLSPREDDEFNRMKLLDRIERSQGVIQGYFEGVVFYHNKIGEDRHALGRIEERLEAC